MIFLQCQDFHPLKRLQISAKLGSVHGIDGLHIDVMPSRPASKEAAQRTFRLSGEAPGSHSETTSACIHQLALFRTSSYHGRQLLTCCGAFIKFIWTVRLHRWYFVHHMTGTRT